MSRRILVAVIVAGFFAHAGWSWSQETKKKKAAPERIEPDLADVKYGPHERNVLDLWKATSDKPTPLVVFIHGGGFRSGSKEGVSPQMISALRNAGISVMAINYRLSPVAKFPDHYLDSARAIQFARHRAKEWNLDPARVASTGGSAGAGTSLWLAFHDDLADPKSDDPVLRESTRLTCVAVSGAQSTYDPRTIREWVGDAAAKHSALQGFYGLNDDELDTPKAHKLYEAAAPINYLTKDDPPVWALYNEPRGPLPADARDGFGIHHINFGLKLKEKMDAHKIECVIRHTDEGGNPNREQVEFLVKHLKGSDETKKPAASIQERLNKKISVNFRRAPLASAIELIAKDTDVAINIDGDALKSSGYTRNMPQDVQLDQTPARVVLGEIFKKHDQKHDQLCLVLDDAKNVAIVTTIRAAQQRGLKPVNLAP